MKSFIKFLVLGVLPALALVLACFGLDMIHRQPVLGWFLLIFGVLYLAGANILYLRHEEWLRLHERFQNMRNKVSFK